MEKVGASINVVLEQLPESHPETGGGGGIPEDEIKDLGRDAHVDPLDDGEVILDPLGIMGLRHGGVFDVGTKIAAIEVNFEEVSPMVVVVGVEIKGDGIYGLISEIVSVKEIMGGIGGGRARVDEEEAATVRAMVAAWRSK